MKSIYHMYQEVKAMEVAELRNKVISKGCSYEWTDEELKPIIAINEGEPEDVYVNSVLVNKETGFTTLHVKGKESGYERIITTNDVFYGHLDFVTSSII